MKLKKRYCPINIELDPYGIDMLDISMDICGKHYDFTASSVMGEQFGAFLYALYGMYYEAPGEKRYHKKLPYNNGWPIKIEHIGDYITSRFRWDSEGHVTIFVLKRLFGSYSYPDYNKTDTIELTINERDTFLVDARDLCYAVAKASTDAMKKYGIYGYHLTCGADANGFGDSIDIERLLFIKAYALNAMEARKISDAGKHPLYPDDDLYCASISPFEKEIELLLFDM